MEHIAAVLLIVGCSNSLEQCRELPAPVSVFETLGECTAERPFAVGDLSQAEPRIFSRCLPVDPALAGLACLPALQLLGERAAQSRNIDTVTPRHLSKVVTLA